MKEGELGMKVASGKKKGPDKELCWRVQVAEHLLFKHDKEIARV